MGTGKHMARQATLTEGPIWRALAVVSAPMSIGILAVLSVGLADAIFLGQYSSTALSAVGFIYPVTTAITSLAIGLSAGANAAISQSIGAEDGKTDRLSLHAFGIAVALGCLTALVFWLTSPLIFGALGAKGETLDAVQGYAVWWAASFPFLVLMMVVNAIFRAAGNTTIPAGIMVLAALVNIALDPLLIFGWGPVPEMGTAGAGLATFMARCAAALAVMVYAIRSGRLGWPDKLLAGIAESAHKIFGVGLPAAFSNAINPAGMAMVTAAVATLGDAAVAGFGAATRVQSLALVPMLALSSGIGPVVGQNWGADNKGRASQAVAVAFAVCLAYGAILGVGLLVASDGIASLMTPDAAAQDHASAYLAAVGLSLFGYGLLVVGNAALNARDKAFWSMGTGLARIGAVYAPGAALGVILAGYNGILAAAIAANLAGAGLIIFAVWRNGLLSRKAVAEVAPVG